MIFTLSLLMSTLKELSSTEYCSLYYNFRNSRTIEYLRFMKNEMNFYKKNHTGVIVTLGFFPPVVYRILVIYFFFFFFIIIFIDFTAFGISQLHLIYQLNLYTVYRYTNPMKLFIRCRKTRTCLLLKNTNLII